jgi:hypothetical protein
VTRHYLGLRDAAVLATRDLLLTGRAITDLIESEAMGAVVGAAGLGKTFAIEHALAGREEQVIRLTFEARPTMRLVADRLLVALTGAPGRGTRFAMTDQLLNRLSDRRRLVVIGEAQNLNRDCFEYLRHLHDDPFTRFALLFDGGDGCWEVLAREPMLRSRIYRRVAFRALSDADVLALIPDYHPIYAGVDPELLVLINEKAANGRLRSWAAFTVVVRRRTVADRAPHHRDRGPVRPAARRAHDRRAENTHLQATGCRGRRGWRCSCSRPDGRIAWSAGCWSAASSGCSLVRSAGCTAPAVSFSVLTRSRLTCTASWRRFARASTLTDRTPARSCSMRRRRRPGAHGSRSGP